MATLNVVGNGCFAGGIGLPAYAVLGSEAAWPHPPSRARPAAPAPPAARRPWTPQKVSRTPATQTPRSNPLHQNPIFGILKIGLAAGAVPLAVGRGRHDACLGRAHEPFFVRPQTRLLLVVSANEAARCAVG